MMEEWHQKLHNNTSPDDVDICAALLAYIDAGLDISAYWATLEACAHYILTPHLPAHVSVEDEPQGMGTFFSTLHLCWHMLLTRMKLL
jgi:hypothetical protein